MSVSPRAASHISAETTLLVAFREAAASKSLSAPLREGVVVGVGDGGHVTET